MITISYDVLEVDEDLVEEDWWTYVGMPYLVKAKSPGGVIRKIIFGPETKYSITDNLLYVIDMPYPMTIDDETLKLLHERRAENKFKLFNR